MEIHNPIELLTCLVWLWSILFIPSVAAARKEHVCSSMDLRNSVTQLSHLENCTVIEGNLQILLIDYAEWPQYRKYTFPDLVEITDYLLLYRAFGLKTLRYLFPNLSVIRGQKLFFNYALVVFQMYDFEEIGLHSLTSIERGAVRLESNPKLCYIETINWSYITNVQKEDHFIMENKNIDECVDVCPRDEKGNNFCPIAKITTQGDIFKQPLCWDADHCQKVCDLKCSIHGCYQTTNEWGESTEKCCHAQCLGGCTGPDNTDCISCKEVSYNGRCLEKCPQGTAKFYNRRCITEKECYSLLDYSHRDNRIRWKVLDTGECTKECPVGYKEVVGEEHKCEQCQGACPKECPGAVVDNVQAAQQLKSCTVITGILEIQIGGGSHVGQELEESLGLIEKVTHYVKVARSYAILSLGFLKNLKEINGERRYMDRHALIVVDNDNLEDIWDFNTHPNLTIYKGGVFIHHNRKLCMSKIKELIKRVGLEGKTDEKDVSPLTNGDQGACDVTRLEVEAMSVNQFFAIVRWTNYQADDSRELLGWVVNYREAPERNVTMYNARDACGMDVWKTVDVKPDSNHNASYVAALVLDLKPATQYALFVRSYTIATTTRAAMSDIFYFTTNTSVPTPPEDLKVEATEAGRLLVQWKPPRKPNGNVTHYYVFYQAQDIDADRFDQRDYCKDKLRHSQYTRTVTIEKGFNTTTKANMSQDGTLGPDGSCSCSDKDEKQTLADEANRIFTIQFQNFLQNSLYQKRRYPLFKKKGGDSDRKSHKDGSSSTAESYRPTTSPEGSQSFSSQRDKRSARETTQTLPGSNHHENGPPEGLTGTNGTFYPNWNSSVTWPPLDPLESDPPHKLAVVDNDTRVILPNLYHYQEYIIEVIACHDPNPADGEKLCSNRAITSARTLADENADTIPAENITVVHKPGDKDVIGIYWPDPPRPNGVIVTYEIELSVVGIADYKPEIYCLQHLEYEENDGGYITNPRKPGNHSFRIRATSLSGNGSWTPMQYFYVSSIEEANAFPLELIIGAVVGSIVLIILVTAGSVWWYVKKRYSQRLPNDVLFASVNPEYWNAGDVYVVDEWEVPRDKIVQGKELGQGSFGMVYEGLAKCLKGDPKSVLKVAIKTVNVNASIRDRIEFLNEASVMKAFNCNHVVKLLGVVSKGQPTLVVMELMANGDLKSFLRAHRPDYSDSSSDKKPPTLKQIMQMAGEIADGMAYLSAEKFVHRDLAARNCMVSEDMVVKIGDFGMTRDIYETDYYRKGGKGLLPVRWMAPESLKDGIFTSLSDVWSFGVVLWEMATLAAQPYQGLANEQVLKYVVDGGIMDKPEGCPEPLYELMCMAWHHNPTDRPTFCEIIEYLIPSLNPSFKEASYFFSKNNHNLGAHNINSEGEDYACSGDESRTPLTGSPKLSHLGSRELDVSDMDYDDGDIESQSDLSYQSRHSCSSRNSRRSSPTPACYHDDPLQARGCDCSKNVELLDRAAKCKPGHGTNSGMNSEQWSPLVTRRPSGNSVSTAPDAESAINSNEGSKGSSKSGSSGTNGYAVANGRVKMLAPMNC